MSTEALPPSDMDLIRQYHAIGVLLNERLKKGSKCVQMQNNCMFIYSADLNSPTGVRIDVSWLATEAKPPVSPNPLSDPTSTQNPS